MSTVSRNNLTTDIEAVKEYQKEPIKYVVFSGGGAKGAAYPGAYDALEQSGIFQNVEAVAGSSAGAMSAAFMATGIKADKFKELTLETNLQKLLGKKGISWPIPLWKDATQMYELMQKVIASNINDFFEKNADISALCVKRIKTITKQEEELKKQSTELNKNLQNLVGDEKKKEEREVLTNEINSIAENLNELNRQNEQLLKIQNDSHDLNELKRRAERKERNEQIYFKDINILRALDPTQFKDLLITAVNKETGKVKIFSPEQTPDVEIALASRASISIPGVINPIEIDGTFYVDGGYRDNIPLEHFAENKEAAKEGEAEEISKIGAKIASLRKDGRSLAFAFGSSPNDEANVAIYSAKKIKSGFQGITKFLVDVIYKMLAKVGGSFKTSKDDEKTYSELRDNALNTVVIDTGPVSTFSFDKAQKTADYLCIKSELLTLQHIVNWDLADKQINGLAERSFFLSVYEEIHKNYPTSSNKYLDFCRKDKWSENDKNITTIQEFINLEPKNKGLAKILCNTLNKRETPDIIKMEFIQACGIECPTDIVNFKFNETHISTIVQSIVKARQEAEKLFSKNGRDGIKLSSSNKPLRKSVLKVIKENARYIKGILKGKY